MNEQYLVGVDGSVPSIAAARWASRRASKTGARLTLLHVQDPALASRGPDASSLQALVAELRTIDPALTVAAIASVGPGVGGILDAAADADLLVLGTHKTGHMHGRAFGSTGIVLANAAPCSVAVVPDGDFRLRRGVVLGALDLVDGFVAALLVADEAASRGDTLTIVRSVANAEPTGEDDLVRTIHVTHPDVPVSIRSVRRSLAPSLLDAALGHSLLVIPEPTSPSSSSMLHDVLMNLTSPVLVARPASTDLRPQQPEKTR